MSIFVIVCLSVVVEFYNWIYLDCSNCKLDSKTVLCTVSGFYHGCFIDVVIASYDSVMCP